ncbi:unnamed protein product [Macrosiphum euphorbiae]|uniref:Uncharacterized protein n=1 Tax=Macrosiphum euphorbiae TaxID=13131 RepID=A0AAV0WDD7_9HEMI|nr:unnamed protein product [Macrosiphum euphorbiae]
MTAHTAQCLQPARPDGSHLHPSFTTSSSSTPSPPRQTPWPMDFIRDHACSSPSSHRRYRLEATSSPHHRSSPALSHRCSCP